ncbi:VCBS domain-containing protein [Bradyrhizobium sp. 142]|uniref:VCBS domain-containing protein n=1 Tax=Bradyrhizobium sp. 142 TaxID=2782618 RepID=UPI001FFB3E23|nr:VCBS domain-containing protein [Bradyrhizobium sp. 142]MCK1727677.1 VCBS domain-containing protein [Bradyrhizobium sp. 142]
MATQTTGGGSTISFGNAPQANNDSFAFTEEANNILVLNVMANDLGGAAKTLFSLDDGSSASPSTKTYAPADLLVKDVAYSSDTAGMTGTGDHSALGARIWIESDGFVHYDKGDINAQLQALAVGATLTDTFTYAIQLGNGTLSWATVTLQFSGANDQVYITSSPQSGTVVEDAPATPDPADSLGAAGTISFSDVDLSDTHSASFAAAASNATTLGIFSLDPVSEAANAANGSVQWHYTLNNAAAQYLAQGQSVTESFVVTVNDGHGSTATQTVTVTITGTNDAATVSSEAKAVTEGDTATALNTSGQLTIVDPDSGEAHVVAQSNVHGSYGDFRIDASGAWSYTGNGAHNELTAGQQVQDQFTVTSQDSTATGTVTVTITGTNDVASVSSDSKSVTEGDIATALNTSGQLTITDPDTGEAHVVAQSNVHGSYGDFSIDANGAWSYAGNGAHNELTAGQQVQDQFTVTSQDGTATGTVTVTVTGTNDVASVSSDSKSVTEGDIATALNTSGQLSITDADTGEAHVVAQSNVHGSYGDFSIDANGAWSYTGNGAHNELTAGQQVQDQFTVASQDGTATGTVTVTITGTNDVASVSSDSKSVTEGDTATALNTSGQLTITDPDTGEAHVVAQSNVHGSYGDFSIDANGAWSYAGNGAHNELTAGQQVQDQFTVTSQDGTATGTVTVTITGTNDAATVSSDAKSVAEADTAAALNTSGQLTITDPDTGEAHVVAQSNAHGSYGDFSIDANGAWSYTGNGAHNELTAGQQVQDQFTVTSQDGIATGTVTVTITGTNDAATVSSESKAVTEADTASALNTSGQLSITDPDTGEAHVVAQSSVHGAYGDFTIDANGAWSYTGNGAHNELTAGQQVQDQFTVASQDGTATGTVTITITGTNDAASVSSDSKSVTEGDTATALNTSGQLTITDPDSGEAHVVAQSNVHGTYGDFSIDANGAWSYAGNGAHNELTAGQQVQDQFTVASQDGTATGTVTITITGTNDAATVSSEAKAVTEGDTATALNTSGQLTIVDPDSGEAHVVVQSSVHGSYGDFSIDANGAWSYTGNGTHNELTAGQQVQDQFTVTSQDGTATGTVTVTITGTNDAATVSSDSKSVTEADTAAALNTSGQLTIVDPDSGEAHVVAQSNVHGSYGDFSIDANGAWSYAGNGAHNELTAGQQVQDQFTVTSQDGTATGTVTVTITGTNDVASVSSDSKSLTEADTAAALNTSGQLTIVDPDSGEAHVVAQSSVHGSYGDFSIDANGAWSYTGNGTHNELTAGQQVQDQFTVISQDGTATGTVTVTITGTNDAATVSSDSKSVTEADTASALNTSGQLSITDPDTGEAHVVAQSNVHGTYGDFTVDANGAWSYTGNGAHDELTAGQQVQDQFTVVSQDGTATGTVTVTITGTNDAATVSSEAKAVTEADTAAALNTSGQLTITDPDTGEAHVVAQSNVHGSYGDFSIDANGAWSYTGNGAHNELTAGQQVQDQFTVVSQDGTATGTVTVTITGTNDAATVSSGAKSVTEADTATALNTSGQLTITDPDSGEAHVVAQSNVHGTYGDFSIDASGAWSYAGNGAHNELTAGQQVQDQFTVASQDGTATGTVTVTITGTNDAATVSSDAKSVTEADTAAALNTSGQLTIVDPDSGEAHVVAQSNAHGSYGDFSIDANGAWSYTGNGAHNELTAGQQVQDQFTVTSQDGTATGTVTVTITGTNDVASVSSDSRSVTEADTATALNTSGQLTITDPDSGEAHVVAQSNVHGTYGDFSIDASGAWSYAGNGAHNELTAGQQVQDQFTVGSQDGTATGTVTVTITGTNDAATVSSEAKAVTEGDTATALNTSGQLTIVDPDSGEAHVVVQSNAHGAYGDFSIDANGAWSYTGNDAHDELTAGQLVQDQFTVVSQDSTATGTVTVTITGTNGAATVSSDSKSVTEGDTAAALNTSGQLSIVDPDSGEAHVVAQSNAHGSYGDFSIDANGAWSYSGNGAHNELTAGQQVQDQFTVVSQDGTASGTVTVTITGTNDAATVSSDSKSVTEADIASALNTSGQLIITDPDTGEAHVVAQSNVHGSYGDFSIDANGAWSYAGNGAHNELTAGQQVQDQFTVVSQDGTASGTVTVTITGTNDVATVSSDSKSVTEGDTAAALNTSGQLTITDPDTGEANVVAQSNARGSYGDFSIDANGAWSYAGNGAHNELTAGQQVQDQFTVVSQDGTATGTVTVTITGTNDAPLPPVDGNAVTNTVAEGAAAGTSVGVTAASSDVDGPAVSYSLVGDSSNGGFAINSTSGVVTVADPSKIDYESAAGHAYSVTVQASDGTLTSQQSFSIAVTDVAPSIPVDGNAATNTVAEGAAAGTSVGITASSSDVDGPAVSYSLVGDSSNGGFAINSTTGVVTVADPSKLDYESAAGHAYSVTVQASDGTLTSQQSFSIAVTDIAPSTPVDGNAATNTVAEGAAAGTSVGVTAASSDVDGPAVSYSLVGDSSNGGFAINSTSGVVTVADPSKIDYESAAGHAYSVTVQASDGTLTSQQSFSIAVTDVAPSIPVDGNAATNTVAEGAAAGTSVGITASSSDVDGPAVSYSLVGDSSNGGFAINSTTGVVTVADPSKISYVGSGSSHSYSVTARASDGALNSQQTFSIAVTQSDITPPTASVSHSLSSSHQTSTFTVTASDASGIKTVQLYDTVTPAGNGSPNQPVLIYTFTAADIVNGNYVHTFIDGQAPFTSLNNDTHKISAVVTDNANNSATVFDPVTFNTNAGSGGSTKFSAPAGIAGSAINLGLTDPTGQMADVTLTITGTLDGWSVHGGTHNADGSWSITTHDLSSLTITTASDYVGASVLKVTEHWTNADGSVGTATVLDNLEAYAPGSPTFAWSGDDTLTGSSGHDTFVLSQPIGNDKIYSFDGSSDLIDLIRYGWQSFSDIQAHSADDANGNAVITLADGQTITLDGVHAADLTAANFEFDATPTVENSGAMSIGNGAMLPLSGIIHNTGTIELHSSGDDTLLQLIQTGVKLDGGGHVILSDDDHNIIAGTAPDVTLDNIDNTISGAGQLGHGNLSLSNAATILADGVHALVIDTGQNVIVNAGTLEATGTGGLQINSAIINTGLLWANGGAVTALGEVSGSGSAEISGIGTIEFGAASSANVTIDANATGHLVLDDAFHFTGTVSGLTADDDVDLKGVNFSGETTLSFTENQTGTGGTLTVSDGAHTANIVLLGQYDPAGFTAKSDIASNTVIAYDPHHIA